MKTINQVLLALIFTAFSTAGFAQSQTPQPRSTMKDVGDIYSHLAEIESSEDEDVENQNEDDSSEKNESLSVQYITLPKSLCKKYTGPHKYKLYTD